MKVPKDSFNFSVILFFLFSQSIYSFGQTQASNKIFDLKQLIPTSPEAAILGRFGDIPVGAYTGTANINIPLFTIREAGIEIPISLSYQSSGIKVEDEATMVGLGWSLEPGGAVIQVVNGKNWDPDPLQNISSSGYQFLKQHGITGSYFERDVIGLNGFIPCAFSDNQNNDNNATLLALSQGYGQPDIYQYSFPGYSGKFFINPETQEIVLIDPKAYLKIVKSDIDEFTITSIEGHRFIFNAVETIAPYVFTDYNSKTLKLTKIIFNNGKSIIFSYQNSYYFSHIYNETFRTDYPAHKSDGFTNKVESHYDYTDHFTKTLTGISSDKIDVNFIYENREDLYTQNNKGLDGVKRLKYLEIIDKVTGKKLKKIVFNYAYFLSGTVGGDYLTRQTPLNYLTYRDVNSKRLKLVSIQEIGFDDQQNELYNPPYSFSYNETNALPLKTSFARDYWGYYNAQNNDKLLPDLSFFYFSDDLDYQTMPSNVVENIQGANRAPDSSKMQAGILKSITYPTGGTSKFEYEPNTFGNHVYPQVERITEATKLLDAADRNLTSDVRSVNFTLNKTQTIKFYNLISKGLNSNVSFYDLQPATITLSKTIAGVTSVIKTWQMFTGDKTEFDAKGGNFERNESITIPYTAGAVYSITCYLPDGLSGQPATGPSSVTSHFSYYLPGTDFVDSYGAGLRVKAIRNYALDNQLLTQKRYRYLNSNNQTSGKIMSPYKPLTSRIVYGVQSIGNTDGGPNYIGSNLKVWYLSSESAIPFSNAAGGNLIGYDRVEEIEVGQTGTENGKHVYNYHNVESETHPNVPDKPDLQNGSLEKEEFFTNGSALPVKEISYGWTWLKSSDFTGYKLVSTFVGDNPSCDMNTSFDPNFWSQVKTWRIMYYPISSRWKIMNSKIELERYGSQSHSKISSFEYNDLGQLKKEATVSSEGLAVSTNYVYPSDVYPNGSTVENSMYSRGLLNNLLSSRSERNGNIVNEMRVTYADFGGIINRSLLEQSFRGGNYNTLYRFDDYGAFMNLKQVSERGIKPISMIWDDSNSVVISQIEGANYSDVAYSSFESSQKGNWETASANRIQNGFTGQKSYDLSNGAISKSGLSSTKSYVVSYWIQNSVPMTLAGTISGFPKKGRSINGWTYFEHIISGQSGVSISGNGLIDELRLYPLGAKMVTYTYGTGFGISAVTDSNNQKSSYEYDGFQRLINVKDQNGNILKHTDYHYQGQ